jgi:hypothetical protein
LFFCDFLGVLGVLGGLVMKKTTYQILSDFYPVEEKG